MKFASVGAGTGALGLQVVRPVKGIVEGSLWATVRQGLPWFGQPREVVAWRFRNLPNLSRGLLKLAVAYTLGLPVHHGALFLRKRCGDGRILDLGLASLRVVTTAGVNYIVDAFQGTVEPENMRYHGFGTGTAAEAVGDTALVTELTTQYATDNTRPTGTLAEGASANVFRTVATLSPDSGGTLAITEHGIFSQAAVAGGVLLDRTVFAAVNLVAGSDSLQATYDHTQTAGS